MKLRFFSAFLLIFALAFTLGEGFAKDGPNSNKLSKPRSTLGVKGSPTYGLLNINNWQYFLEANGRSGVNPFIDGDGGIFPRGTSYVVYQDGFIFGGAMAVAATGLPPAAERIRVGGQTYNIGTVAGAVVNGVPENPNDPGVRLYRIRRDINDGVDLTQDAADFLNININEATAADVAALKAQYLKDWDEWPVAKGAPYVDRNKNGRYDKPPAGLTSRQLIEGNYDEPGLAGVDPNSPAGQVMWTVCNDFNESATRGLYGAAPIGVELQITVWGYPRTDALGNVLFKKFRLLNKGTLKSDTMYVCQWSDADLGDFGDDFTGCDVSQVAGKSVSLGFIYNSNSIDREFRKFNIPPPSGGYDFFQGPLVAGAATDVGIFDLKKRPGFTNLGMSSFNYFSANSGINDPPLTQYEGTLRWWKMLRGFVADASTRADRKWIDPQGNPTNYPLAGDPVAKTGWIDGSAVGTPAALPPGDRRFLLVSGPFKFAPGDTQEVVVGVVAGLGADRLSSISVMKFSDRFAQNTYDALFAVPSAPKAPNVVVGQLDGELVLEWGSNLGNVRQSETENAAPYVFQGYNIYQFPSRSSTLKDGVRLATYDLVDETTVVLDDQFDQASGQILRLPVQLGSNSGIFRYHRATGDAVAGRPKLRNGQEYYFGVTAYSVSTNPFATPLTLESTPVIKAVVPQSPAPGTRYPAEFGDKPSVAHTSGKSDGAAASDIVDPTVTTGKPYQITFKNIPTAFIYGPDSNGDRDTVTVPILNWFVKRDAQTIFQGTNLGPAVAISPGSHNLAEEFPTVFGDVFDYPILDGFLLKVAGPAPQLNSGRSGYKSGTDWTTASGAGRFRPSTAVLRGHVTTAYDVGLYLGATGPGVTPDKFADIEFRFGDGGSLTQKGYRYRRIGTYQFQNYTDVPFQVWDISGATPRQLNVGWRDQNNNGKWDPNGGVEVIFVATSTYDGDTPTTFTYGTTVGDAVNTIVLKDFQYLAEWISANGVQADIKQSVIRVSPNYVLTESDVYTFTPPAVTKSVELAKLDVNKINVFPNPYYALNAAETSRFVRFVTFNFLPQKATIRIFNVAGQLVRILQKDDDSQFMRWDLTNANNFPAASGMYIAHIDMPDVGATKVLKFAVIQEQEVLEVF